MDYIGYIIAGVVLLLGIVLLVCGYLKAPPDTAYIISGFHAGTDISCFTLTQTTGTLLRAGGPDLPAGDAGGRQDLRGRAYQ